MRPADTLESEWVPFSCAAWQSGMKKPPCLGGHTWLWLTGLHIAVYLPACFGPCTGIWDKHKGHLLLTGMGQWGPHVTGLWKQGAAMGSWPREASSRLPSLKRHSKSTRSSLAAGVQHRHEKASSQMKVQPRCETAIIAWLHQLNWGHSPIHFLVCLFWEGNFFVVFCSCNLICPSFSCAVETSWVEIPVTCFHLFPLGMQATGTGLWAHWPTCH